MAVPKAEAWGIEPGYHDIAGDWRTPTPEAEAALLAAMGAASAEPDAIRAPLVVTAGEQPAIPEPELLTEDGALLELDGRLPAELPPGYHRLRDDRQERRLIVSPGRCCLPERLRGFGLAVQLYSLLSGGSAGIGDLADLRVLADWAGTDLGAAFLLVNPLHAPLPGLPQEPSPYYPSSRRFLNPLYLRLDWLPESERQELNAEGLVRRDRVHELKLPALEARWETVRGRVEKELREFRSRRPGLREYAVFCALTETHGRPWREWPEELRHPASPAVARFARAQSVRVHFHEWLQLILDRQLQDAGAAPAGLVNDLAIGVNPDGADAWAWQDQLAAGVSVGAPPDPFNAEGQDWGLPPFDPWRLRGAAYEPFVQTLRAAFRHASGIRVDHIMGLFRLYWIPADSGPAGGAYVRYPATDLLHILGLESWRAGAYVVGEDLGTVQDEVREELRRRRILSYKLYWFERRDPAHYPEQALAALTTHDLPTLAGVWTGRDAMPEVQARLARLPGADQDVLRAAYTALAAAPCRLLAATLEDVTGMAERPNRPGTIDEHPNWSLRLPLTLEELMADPRPHALAGILRRD
ncbi:MAG: 4-alpha-glucanotransferase [Chloroflexi bacterium]|nr:MAG: 4-alpha-glucanotransferase [Chloroflexota bacterium]